MVDQNERGDPELAERMQRAIDFSGRSQRQIALEVGVTPQSATKWLKYGYMDKGNIPAFCRATGVSIEWFLTGKGDIAESNPLKEASVQQVIRALEDLPDDLIGEVLQRLGEHVQQRTRKPK